MATTMREVAAAAGVSIATVSFVVNDSKRVAPETRRRIEAAMAELGFRRNVVARALASRRTRIIALAYPVLEHRLAESGMEFITSAARAASDADHHLVVWPVSNDGRELAALVGQQLVDGVLLMEVQIDDARVTALRRLDIPFALIGRTGEPGDLAHVDIDFDQTIELAVDHLWGLGHRRLVLVSGSQAERGFQSYGPYVRLEAAYRRLATARGFEADILDCAQTTAAGREAAAAILGARPATTAILILNEFAALGLVSGLLRSGVRVPEDMSVLSMLTSLGMATLTDPALTLMASPGAELGRLGVEALLRLLDGEPAPPPRLLPAVLVPGGSTAPARRGDGSSGGR